MKEHTHSSQRSVSLTGLDGSNPLSFLAALGIVQVLRNATLYWKCGDNFWRPCIAADAHTEEELAARVFRSLDSELGMPWRVNKRLPFGAIEFREEMLKSIRVPDFGRRVLDLLAAFGSEAIVDDDTGNFQDTAFRMVRSGDANKCGMPDYACRNAERCRESDIHAALFGPWTYAPKLSLRWDPGENKEYALQANNPSSESPLCAVGANRLAIEALSLYPTMPGTRGLETVGFTRVRDAKDLEFRWPIWDVPLGIDTIRSLLTCPLLYKAATSVEQLREMGIATVFSARQIRPNQYYRNFTPSFQV